MKPGHQAIAGAAGGRDWPDSEPLAEQLTAHPYPVDVLPSLMRDAVKEVQSFVQAPAVLVACSALAALSLAAQGLVNVRRDQQLVGPISVYLLSVADSGERKTTCDAMFCRALRDWESERRQALLPDIAHAEAAAAVFEAKKAGILDAIKLKRRKGEDTSGRERELRDFVRDPPQALRVPRLLYADATQKRWPFRWRRDGRAAVSFRPRRARCSVHTAWVRKRSCAISPCSMCSGSAARSRSIAARSRPFSCAAGGSPSG
jgi:putative DNA primase/helicase